MTKGSPENYFPKPTGTEQLVLTERDAYLLHAHVPNRVLIHVIRPKYAYFGFNYEFKSHQHWSMIVYCNGLVTVNYSPFGRFGELEESMPTTEELEKIDAKCTVRQVQIVSNPPYSVLIPLAMGICIAGLCILSQSYFTAINSENNRRQFDILSNKIDALNNFKGVHGPSGPTGVPGPPGIVVDNSNLSTELSPKIIEPGNKVLKAGRCTNAVNILDSDDGSYELLYVPSDGLYSQGVRTKTTAHYYHKTRKSYATRLCMQNDGNLVLYNLYNDKALWASETAGQDYNAARLNNEGKIELFKE